MTDTQQEAVRQLEVLRGRFERGFHEWPLLHHNIRFFAKVGNLSSIWLHRPRDQKIARQQVNENQWPNFSVERSRIWLRVNPNRSVALGEYWSSDDSTPDGEHPKGLDGFLALADVAVRAVEKSLQAFEDCDLPDIRKLLENQSLYLPTHSWLLTLYEITFRHFSPYLFSDVELNEQLKSGSPPACRVEVVPLAIDGHESNVTTPIDLGTFTKTEQAMAALADYDRTHEGRRRARFVILGGGSGEGVSFDSLEDVVRQQAIFSQIALSQDVFSSSVAGIDFIASRLAGALGKAFVPWDEETEARNK